jgi:hypothetical protein
MVKALHRAGIEVILDVVFNHTAEGADRGPRWALKALITVFITFWNRIKGATPTTVERAIRSIPIILLCAA